MLRAYWLRILLCGLLGGLIALGISFVVKKKFQADVTLKVDQSIPATDLSETAQAESVLDWTQFSRPRNIITQVDQLQSLGTLTAAAKAVASENGLPDPTLNPQDELNPVNLQNSVNITADQTSDIINLEVRLSSPKLAEDAANQIYLAFVGENDDSTKEFAQRAISSLKSQSDSITTQLQDIDQKISDLRSQTGMSDPQTQTTAEITGLTTLKAARDQAATDAAAAHQSVQVLTQELAKTPMYIKGATTTSTNPLWEKLQEDLLTAQSDRAALLQTYDPENEQVRTVDERIKNIQSQITKVKMNIPSATNQDLNANYQSLQQQLSTAKAAADAADQKYTVSAQQVSDKEKFLGTLPPILTKLNSLDRQRTNLEKIDAGYQDKLKTLEAAKEGRSSPTQMITPATALPDPVSPKIWINAVFGLVVGLLLGVASVQVLEAKRQPIRSLVQLNGLAREPVYRMVPELREPLRALDRVPHESYESLLVHFLKSDARPYRLGVVGLNRDSGASTAALNIALSASRHGSKVLFVQCDAKGALGRVGHRNPKFGQVFEITKEVDGLATPTVLNLTTSRDGIDPHVLALEKDLTVIDLEPASRSAEFAFLAPKVDEMILLVRAGKGRGAEFLQAQQALYDSGCKKVTVVFARSSDFAVTVDAVDSDKPITPVWPAGVATKPAPEPVVVDAPVIEPGPALYEPEPEVKPEPVSFEPRSADEPFVTPEALTETEVVPKPEPVDEPEAEAVHYHMPEPLFQPLEPPAEGETAEAVMEALHEPAAEREIQHSEPEPTSDVWTQGQPVPESAASVAARAEEAEQSARVPLTAAEVAAATTHEEDEGPVRRPRRTPTVIAEDFGGITRTRPAPQIDEPVKPAEKGTARPRRSSIDTSDIDS